MSFVHIIIQHSSSIAAKAHTGSRYQLDCKEEQERMEELRFWHAFGDPSTFVGSVMNRH